MVSLAEVERLKGMLQTKGYKAFRDGTLRSVSMELPVADFKTLIQLSKLDTLWRVGDLTRNTE